jgi:hypothetical protein
MEGAMKPIGFAILVFFIIGISPASAEFYQWTDENGVMRWTDTPPPSTQEVKVFESVKSSPQIPEETSVPPPVAEEKKETGASVEETTVKAKEPYYDQTYDALKKMAAGLSTGLTWELYHQWVGEAGFEVSRLKKAHSDWEQRNDRYESRCEELIAAYECYADALDIWTYRRQQKQSQCIAKLKVIDKKYPIHNSPIWKIDERSPYEWVSVSEQIEQFLFVEARQKLDAYEKMK